MRTVRIARVDQTLWLAGTIYTMGSCRGPDCSNGNLLGQGLQGANATSIDFSNATVNTMRLQSTSVPEQIQLPTVEPKTSCLQSSSSSVATPELTFRGISCSTYSTVLAASHDESARELFVVVGGSCKQRASIYMG